MKEVSSYIREFSSTFGKLSLLPPVRSSVSSEIPYYLVLIILAGGG